MKMNDFFDEMVYGANEIIRYRDDFVDRARNTCFIFWVELWIRRNEFHWSLNSFSYEYVYSFFSPNRRSKGIDYLIARRNIAHNIDDDKHQIKTFILRQVAWFIFCHKNKYPNFVFSHARMFAH